MLKPYLKRIYEIANRGDAREESYYSILEGLLKEYTESVGLSACGHAQAGKRNIHITTLPKKTEAGNPDFRIWDGKQHIVGYIEAKAPTVERLDHIQTTEQLKRYRHTFPNLILTNFFEFRLYRNGTLIDKVLIARPFIVHKLKDIPPVEKESDFLKLLERFFSFSLPKVYAAKTLAIELAKRTRFLKDEVIAEELIEEVWQYQIGGYQVCSKWLKDRKKRLLSLDDIKHYCKIVTSLQKTIEVQKAIDDIYPEVEKETIESKIGKNNIV